MPTMSFLTKAKLQKSLVKRAEGVIQMGLEHPESNPSLATQMKRNLWTILESAPCLIINRNQYAPSLHQLTKLSTWLIPSSRIKCSKRKRLVKIATMLNQTLQSVKKRMLTPPSNQSPPKAHRKSQRLRH